MAITHPLSRPELNHEERYGRNLKETTRQSYINSAEKQEFAGDIFNLIEKFLSPSDESKQAPSSSPSTIPITSSPTSLPTTLSPTIKPTVSPTTLSSTIKPTASPTTPPPTVKPSVLPTTSSLISYPTSPPTDPILTNSPTITPISEKIPSKHKSPSRSTLKPTTDSSYLRTNKPSFYHEEYEIVIIPPSKKGPPTVSEDSAPPASIVGPTILKSLISVTAIAALIFSCVLILFYIKKKHKSSSRPTNNLVYCPTDFTDDHSKKSSQASVENSSYKGDLHDSTPNEINFAPTETPKKLSLLSSGVGSGLGDTYSIQSAPLSITSFERECVEEGISYQKRPMANNAVEEIIPSAEQIVDDLEIKLDDFEKIWNDTRKS